jgi:hypothetical protein
MPGVAPTVNEAKPALVDPLTERERTILRYLVDAKRQIVGARRT